MVHANGHARTAGQGNPDISTAATQAIRLDYNPFPARNMAHTCGPPTCCKRKSSERDKNYIFCPLAHHLAILRLFVKHHCQHSLLPDRHGEPRSARQIYADAVYEMYTHCHNNNLNNVWGYLWTSWYQPDEWKLWACSAHAAAIPRKRTTMEVEALWRNLKRGTLYRYNRPCLDFTCFLLVTESLAPYCYKLSNIIHNPRKGRSKSLTDEQEAFKKNWKILKSLPLTGRSYDTQPLLWTCNCGAQKYNSYLLCKHLVQTCQNPPAEWWPTVDRKEMIPFYDVSSFYIRQDTDRVAGANAPDELGTFASNVVRHFLSLLVNHVTYIY